MTRTMFRRLLPLAGIVTTAVVAVLAYAPRANAVIYGSSSQQVIKPPTAPPSLPAGVSCTGRTCSGPASKLIHVVRATTTGTFIVLGVPNTYLTCSTAVSGLRPMSLPSGTAQNGMMAVILSAVASDHGLTVEWSTAATCAVSRVDLQ